MKPGWMDRRLLSSIKLLHKTPLRDAPISRSRLNDQFLLSFVFWDQFRSWGGGPPPTRKSPDTSWVPYNSIQFWLSLPGDSIRLHMLRITSAGLLPSPCTADAICNPRLIACCFWPTGYKSEVPKSDKFARVAHGTQKNTLLTRSPVNYKRIELRNRQIQEMQRVRYGEGVQSFHTLSRSTTFPMSPCVCQPRSPNPGLLGFYGYLIT